MHLSLSCHCSCRRFVMCALQLAVLVQSFWNPGHISLVPMSRQQTILGALQFHLWLLEGQMWFSCVQDFNKFSSYSHQICIGPRSWCQSIFGTLLFYLWPLRVQIHLSLQYTVYSRVFSLSFSNSHHTFLRQRSRCQLIFGTLQFHFWQWVQVRFSYMCPTILSFQLIFS